MSTKSTGDWGEALVANYLRDRGYTVVASGYRCRFGEIDLIAKKGGMVCFVEVKLRSNLKYGLPREYVTVAKREKLRMTAQFYLSAHELDVPARFDVAEVYADAAHTGTRIEYIENAF